MPPLSSQLLHDIRLAHLKQLAQLQLPQEGRKKSPTDAPDPSVLPMILRWIEENPGAIAAAQNTREIRLPQAITRLC